MIRNNDEAVTRGSRARRGRETEWDEGTRPRLFSYRLCIRSSASNCGFLLTSKHFSPLPLPEHSHEEEVVRGPNRGFTMFDVAGSPGLVVTCYRRRRRRPMDGKRVPLRCELYYTSYGFTN